MTHVAEGPAQPTIGSLCTGYGGLDHGVQAALGGDIVWVADPDPGAATLLTRRYPEVPNLGDIRAIDWSAVEPVTLLTAGWPCQPVSNAGRRQGVMDARWIWPAVAAAIRAVRPRLVFLENVAALTSRGLDRVTADLAKSGYMGSWRYIRASDIGTPHQRERVFILASLADTASPRLEVRRKRRPRRTTATAHAHRDTWGCHSSAIRQWELITGRAAPPPLERGRTRLRLSPRFTEWLMGLPEGWVTDPTLGLTRTQQLTLLGNGVVPQQAEHALDTLTQPTHNPPHPQPAVAEGAHW